MKWFIPFLLCFQSACCSVPSEIWEKIEPYFLPSDHPIKENLDQFFQTRVTESLESFQKAGFKNAFLREPTNIVFGKHPLFKGYLFKVYLDSQPSLCEWDNWVKRIDGAKAIKECIDQHCFTHFVVPNKWIYPLPQDNYEKNFILIVEEIPLLKGKENSIKYKKGMTPQILDELFCIITEAGLLDSVFRNNIPFAKTGQIAFIDTEHSGFPPECIPYGRLLPYLSKEMQVYWLGIIEKKLNLK